MGYSTEFRGKLEFKKEATAKLLTKVKTFLGEDCRDHPEWGATNMTYIELKLTDDFGGLEWDGSEKTYDLVEKVNLIINKVKEEYPDFELEGELMAQGDDIEDRWKLKIENGQAIEVKIQVTGKKCECPHCGEDFILEQEAQELLDDIKSGQINWKELRSKFFDECTDKDANGNSLPKVNITPSNLFEWFKNEINNY